MNCSINCPLVKVNAVLISIILMFLTGCYEMHTGESQGTLVVPYSISYNGTTCEAAGVVTVRAVLDDGLFESETDCTDYEIVFNDVDAGSYSLTAYGLDKNGVPVVDSLLNGPEEVLIEGDDVVEMIPLALTEAPVNLQLRWKLGWHTCETTQIQKYQVSVFDKDTGKKILSSKLSCRTSGVGDEGYRLLPDKKRKLVNHNFNEITVQGINDRGKSLGEAFKIVFLEGDDFEIPGPGGDIKMSLFCNNWGCFYMEDGC